MQGKKGPRAGNVGVGVGCVLGADEWRSNIEV